MLIFLRHYFVILRNIFIVCFVCSVLLLLFVAELQKNKQQLVQNVSQRDIYISNINSQLDKLKVESAGDPLKGVIYFVTKNTACSLIGVACSNVQQEKNSLSHIITTGISLPIINQPASGSTWVAMQLEQAGFTPKTYAANGLGFSSLLAFLPIWKLFRDLAFMLLTIGIVFVGFMVIFKIKLGGKTEVTLQNSLPKLVIAMILINFSFAIAGFMIDLTQISMALIVNYMSERVPQAAGIGNIYTAKEFNLIGFVIGSSCNPAEGFSFMGLFGAPCQVRTVADTLLNLIPYQVENFITFGLGVYMTWIILQFPTALELAKEGSIALGEMSPFGGAGIGRLLGVGFFVGLFSAFMGAPQLLLIPIVYISIIVIYARIIFSLWRAYIDILLSIILAPVTLIGEILPSNDSFMKWAKSLAGNLLVYPLILGIIAISSMIGNINTSTTNFWVPPFLSVDANNSQGFVALISLVLLASAPDIIKSFKKSMGVADNNFFQNALPALAAGSFFLRPFGQLRDFGTGLVRNTLKEKFKDTNYRGYGNLMNVIGNSDDVIIVDEGGGVKKRVVRNDYIMKQRKALQEATSEVEIAKIREKILSAQGHGHS
jgi:hypothetical protein